MTKKKEVWNINVLYFGLTQRTLTHKYACRQKEAESQIARNPLGPHVARSLFSSNIPNSDQHKRSWIAPQRRVSDLTNWLAFLSFSECVSMCLNANLWSILTCWILLETVTVDVRVEGFYHGTCFSYWCAFFLSSKITPKLLSVWIKKIHQNCLKN